jgi:glycosyltransferase 2 family protein
MVATAPARPLTPHPTPTDPAALPWYGTTAVAAGPTTRTMRPTSARRPGPAATMRPLPRPDRAPAAGPAVPPAAPGVGAGRVRWVGRVVAGGLVLVAAGLLVVQLRDADLAAAFAGVDLRLVAVGIGWFALSLVAAAYTVTGFSPLPLRIGPTLQAQLAVGGLRLVVPAAASMPAVVVRYLTRSGATLADAAATVAAGQAAQLAATVAVVAALGAGADAAPGRPTGTAALVLVAALAALGVAGLVAARCSRAARAGLAATWRGQVALARHARSHPGQVATGLAASAALTLTHVLAFAACVQAAGGSLPLVTCAAIYLGAATAGSLVPAPGGIGPVEAALVAGLSAAGLPLPAATAAALLSRLVSVWIPAVPGLLALTHLRRRGLL